MVRFAGLLAAVALLGLSTGHAVAAPADHPATTVAQASTSTAAGTVTGTVKDDGGIPIAAATVSLVGAKTYSAQSDATGAFSVAGVAPGLYRLIVAKPGYQTATESDFAVLSGTTQTVAAVMHRATFSSLRTIASVRSVGPGTFNTGTSAINVVSSAQFQDQAQVQVTRVLNQIPGIQISYPGGSANAAVPGAITFPNIRGALSYETASLIDGHPVSVGTYGDYVTTFLNSFMFQNVELIKGPGAMAPEVNYAIGGTVNFRTKDPTATMTPDYSFGYLTTGGTYANIGVSDTVANRLGFVVDVASYNDPSVLRNQNIQYNTGNGAVIGWGTSAPIVTYYNNAPLKIPGTASSFYGANAIVACCETISGNYNAISELVKARYQFSDATVATVSYLGSQANVAQLGSTSAQYNGLFSPSQVNPFATYTGSIPDPSRLLYTDTFPGGTEAEVNNEPIFQAEVRTTLGNDTILARYYHASIDRLLNEGNPNPFLPVVLNQRVVGTNSNWYYNGESFSGTYPVAYFSYYEQAELDKLRGFSFEWDHPLSDGDLTFAVDQTNSSTTSYSQFPNVCTQAVYSCGTVPLSNPASDYFAGATLGNSVTIPTGAQQTFTTYLLRGRFDLSSKLAATASLYENVYKSTYAKECLDATGAIGAACDINGANAVFVTSTPSHFDERFGLEYRPQTDLAIRFAAGSAIAPPYMALLNTPNGTVSYSKGANFATQQVNAGTLLPETAWGYDLGGDYRLKDGVTFVSADFYLTNLFNHFISDTYPSPYTCGTSPTPCPSGVAPGIPIFFTSNINLSNSRFEGIEAQIRRLPREGFGYNLSGALSRGYAYNIGPSIYCAFKITAMTPCIRSTYDSNLGILTGNNFTGGALSTSANLNGFSNQSIPYLQANGEINYTGANGAYAAFGDTVYGKNNSLNRPPFSIAYVTVRYPVAPTISLQVSGDNVFNAYSGVLPIEGGGVQIPLANGQARRHHGQRARPGHLHVRGHQDVRGRRADGQPR